MSTSRAFKQSIYSGYENYFKELKNIKPIDLTDYLKVTIRISKDDSNIKRSLFSGREIEKPPIVDMRFIHIEGLGFHNKDLLIIKGIEYYLLAFYAQWKSQYRYRRYSDLVNYLGNDYEITQNIDHLEITPNVTDPALINSLFLNLFVALKIKLSDSFENEETSRWWGFIQRVDQFGVRILDDIDQRKSIKIPAFSFINSIYKIGLPTS